MRHPLERVLSVYRSVYEGRRQLSWPKFVELVLSSGYWYHGVAPQWYHHTAPYWKHCGLCRPELRPKYILHMDKLGQWELEILLLYFLFY